MMKSFRFQPILLILFCSTSCFSNERALVPMDVTPDKFDHYAFISPSDAKQKFKLSSRGSQDILKQANSILKMKPFPLEKVHVEGVLNFKDASNIKDWSKTLSLAIAYRLTHDSRYLAKAREFLSAWLNLFYLSKNYIPITQSCAVYPIPNPGIECVDPIDDTELSTLVLAYDIVRDDLSEDVKKNMFRFMRNLAMSYLEDIEMRSARAESAEYQTPKHYLYTNWHSHRIKLAMMSAFETGDPALIKRAIAAFKKQISKNLIYPGNLSVYESCRNNMPLSTEQKSNLEKELTLIDNGSVFDFYQRNAIHYAVFDIEPLLQAAFIVHANGLDENLYTYTAENGARLANGVKWLQPFAEGSIQHREFVNSSVSFDAKRAKLGLKDYSDIWKPINAKGLFYLAIIFDKTLLTENMIRLLGSGYDGYVYDPWFINKFASRQLLNYVWNSVSSAPFEPD